MQAVGSNGINQSPLALLLPRARRHDDPVPEDCSLVLDLGLYPVSCILFPPFPLDPPINRSVCRQAGRGCWFGWPEFDSGGGGLRNEEPQPRRHRDRQTDRGRGGRKTGREK